MTVDNLGYLNLIHIALKDLLSVLKARPKKDSKRPENGLDFVLRKTAESRADGKLELKNSGME